MFAACTTVAGPGAGKECAFPFTVGEVVHKACTLHLAASDGEHW